ncbi:MAG TPA: NADP-dependent oxidoreductase [Longimicrobiaceae bacterium]|nr:NADP-dependent oxidoreductase [Longimicrobiaceae bacterium]
MLDLDEPRDVAADEVVIDVRAGGVGNWDELVRVGSWRVGGPPPMALGVEAAGVVARVGDAVAGFAVGDEVMAHPLPLRRNGTWAERALAPASTLALKPPTVSFDSAAAFPVPALTALQVLDEALAIQRGEWVLVHGAGGVTGGLLVQLAAARGASVIATASRAKAGRLRGHGAREVLDYHDQAWPELIREITGGAGVAKAANAARGGAGTALRAVATGGSLATITGDPPGSERGVAVSSVYVRPDGQQLSALVALLVDGTLRFEAAVVRPLAHAATALADAASGRTDGPVVLSLTARD